MKKKPDKMNIFTYVRRKIKKALLINNRIKEKFGWWFCGVCVQYHSPLVVRYRIMDGFCDDCCSLGYEDLKDKGNIVRVN